MANQTVTTVVNYDDAAISGLLNGETSTINGGSVTIDADVRFNQQAAVFGAVTLSASLGGSFLLDGTRIWDGILFDVTDERTLEARRAEIEAARRRQLDKFAQLGRRH